MDRIKADPQGGKGDRIPLDAKLLGEAVIELNISRRSVSLYPKEHPITREALNRAYQFLQKLFELRPEITLGIAKDSLIVDEYTLDRKNPVFKEFNVAIADFFDAMRTHRAYRRSLGVHDVIKLMIEYAGKDFNPLLVENFVDGLKRIHAF